MGSEHNYNTLYYTPKYLGKVNTASVEPGEYMNAGGIQNTVVTNGCAIKSRLLVERYLQIMHFVR